MSAFGFVFVFFYSFKANDTNSYTLLLKDFSTFTSMVLILSYIVSLSECLKKQARNITTPLECVHNANKLQTLQQTPLGNKNAS